MTAFGDYHRGGSGPPLLLIHGFTGTWRAWGPVIGMLEQQFEVLAPTVGGHTDGPELEDVSMDGILDGLEAMLDEVGWRTAHLAGWSMGGQLALELAVRGRAQSVCAISPAGAYTSGTEREVKRIGRLFRREHGAAARGARVTARLLRSPGFRRVALRTQMLNGDRVLSDEATAMTQAFADTPLFGPLFEAFSSGRELRGLERIEVPTTIVWGDSDHVLPQDKHEAFFRERLPRARFVTLKRAGHTPFWDAPERIADAIAQTALSRERSAA